MTLTGVLGLGEHHHSYIKVGQAMLQTPQKKSRVPSYKSSLRLLVTIFLLLVFYDFGAYIAYVLKTHFTQEH